MTKKPNGTGSEEDFSVEKFRKSWAMSPNWIHYAVYVALAAIVLGMLKTCMFGA